MTSKKTVSVRSQSNVSTTEAATDTSNQAATPVAPSVSTAGATASASSIIFINPPPALSTIPAVPDGSQNTNRHDYVASLPRNLELAAMPDVIAELQRFTDYVTVFGKTAPPLAFVLQTATAAGGWSATRVKSATWDQYARSQEGVAWSDFRTIMDSLRPALALAVTTDGAIARTYPSLVRLFGAKSVIAQRGATTRAANRAAEAAGKPPVRGKLAKKARRLKSAAATLAAAGESVVLPPGSGVQVSIAPSAPAVSTPAPTAPVTAVTGTNGAAHS